MKNIKIKWLKFKMNFLPRLSGKNDMNLILAHDGISVGKETIFYAPHTMNIDRERPWMLKIGDYCKICAGTVILTHDYSRSVLRRKYGDVVGEAGMTTIGDNVFIGMNSIILMGTRIGNNVIVGAGSVVHGDVPDDVVVACNPAKVICTIEEMYKKRKSAIIEAACLFYNSFVDEYKRNPTPREMGPFFNLFSDRNQEYLEKHQIRLVLSGDSVQEALEFFYKTEKAFETYEHFSEYARSHR